MAADRGPVAGIDIDGVLADPSHRLHFIEGRPRNWRGFFGQAHHDPPLSEGIAVVREQVDRGVAILYVTGRPEYLRRRTTTWLEAQGLPVTTLYMRRRGDFRPAPEMKLEVYRAISIEFDLEVIVDDDERVVDTLRGAGFPVRLADWYRPAAPEARALERAQDDDGRS